MMKRLLIVIMAFVSLALPCGCSSNRGHQAILPPVRTAESGGQASLGKSFTFNTAFAEADAVARIEIGDWLGEDNWEEDVPLGSTYYNAKVLQCFKGNLSETFTLIQDGCSTWTLDNYPLFTAGNELLVFLSEAVGETHGNAYWIIGSFTTVLDVSYDRAGNRYYIDRTGMLGETVDARNYAFDNSTYNEVSSRMSASDPLFEMATQSNIYIFAESDMLPLLEKSE